MRPRAKALALLLLALAGASLPCCTDRVQAGNTCEVLPSRHQVIQSRNRGRHEEIVYVLRSSLADDLRVVIAAKSCDCLDATADGARVPAGGEVRLRIAGRVPEAGVSHGSVFVRLEPDVPGQAHERREVLLTYELRALMEDGLHVVPRTIVLGAQDPGGPRTLSLLSRSATKPREIRIHPQGVAAALDWEVLSGWTPAPAGGWSALIELSLPARAERGDYTAIALEVVTESGESLSAALTIEDGE